MIFAVKRLKCARVVLKIYHKHTIDGLEPKILEKDINEVEGGISHHWRLMIPDD